MVDATSSPVIVSIVNTLETALTPVFLLAGTAGFLNAFVARLARISDRVNEISQLIDVDHELNAERRIQLKYLRIRTLALQIAIVFVTCAGVLTCLSIISLLAGAIGRSGFRAHVLYWLFGSAVFCLVGALIAFLFEMLSASQSMLRQIARDQRVKQR
ncbi:DUF2721 domain-containing protein [Phyllobacterium sp. CCNWLW109]|uniref:DUF2721 domain-containing protein n=1 Tax=Phyllobacterium sp. CCNWLW109 TaxID=3127479 RepID=UPI00307894FE